MYGSTLIGVSEEMSLSRVQSARAHDTISLRNGFSDLTDALSRTLSEGVAGRSNAMR